MDNIHKSICYSGPIELFKIQLQIFENHNLNTAAISPLIKFNK